MKNVTIIGVGKMGSAIAWAMDRLGFRVMGVDSRAASAQVLNGLGNQHSFRLVGRGFVSDYSSLDKLFTANIHSQIVAPDVVISSLPYHQTEPLADYCIEHGLRYCDLGGRVDVSDRINKSAVEKATKPIMTDLGLAPGWVNILTEWGCKEIRKSPEEVKMMVGGLPGIPDNPPLNYAVTWSVDGLINEYKDDCEVLVNGEIIKVPGMEGLETVYIKKIDEELEAFYTSGGASHTTYLMKERGIKNCSYKTLRYKGHGDAVKFLIRKCELDDDCLTPIFENGCASRHGDIVIIKVEIKAGEISWNKEILIPYDDDFTAMQKGTAFPVSAIASLMAEGYFDGDKEQHRDYWTKYPKNLSYKDIPFEEFNKKINLLGLEM
tara:strand:- start:10 stop:1143 length:1134 start_codon:yes stop_codon:yes gene_type:complete